MAITHVETVYLMWLIMTGQSNFRWKCSVRNIGQIILYSKDKIIAGSHSLHREPKKN